MAGLTKKGKLCLVYVGVPLSVYPEAVEDPLIIITQGGLPYYSSITNMPTMQRIVSATSHKMTKQKNSEQRHYLGGSDIGETVQANSQVTGTTMIDVLSNADNTAIDPGLDILKRASDLENYFLFVYSEIPFTGAKHPTPGKYLYEVKGAIVAVNSDLTNDASAITTPESFSYQGSGTYFHGYIVK